MSKDERRILSGARKVEAESDWKTERSFVARIGEK